MLIRSTKIGMLNISSQHVATYMGHVCHGNANVDFEPDTCMSIYPMCIYIYIQYCIYIYTVCAKKYSLKHCHQ